jgi:hypothetical protein
MSDGNTDAAPRVTASPGRFGDLAPDCHPSSRAISFHVPSQSRMPRAAKLLRTSLGDGALLGTIV